MEEKSDEHETVSPTEARQGGAGRANLRVLIAALAALAAIAVALYAYFYSRDLPSISLLTQ